MSQEKLVIVREADTVARRGPSKGNAPRAADASARQASDEMLFSVRRDIVLRNGKIGVLFHLLFSTVVGVVLYGSGVPKIYVSGWLGAMVLIMLVRMVFITTATRQGTDVTEPIIGFAVISGGLIGVGWGLCGLFLFLGLNTSESLVVVVACVGAMFGAATNGARLWVFLVWVTPSLAPIFAYGVVHAGIEYSALAVITVLLGFAMTRSSRNSTHLFKRSAALVGTIQRADQRLRDSARRFRIIADHSHDWETWWDRNGHLVWTSPSVERFTGYSDEEVMLNPDLVMVDTIHPEDRDRLEKAVRVGRTMRERGDIEFRIVHRDGTVRWCESVSNPIIDENGQVDGFRSSVRDISVQKRLEADLEQLASVDSLTNLLNRRAFLEKATEEIYRAGRYDKQLVIAVIDVDHFKRINDTHGHAVGDRCLVALADIVRKSIRQSDLFARFGGEEFVLMLPETELAHGMQLCERLRRRVEISPVECGEETIRMSVSIGVADFQPSTTSLDALIGRADAALYSAKRNGRNQIAYGSASATVRALNDTPTVERLSRTA